MNDTTSTIDHDDIPDWAWEIIERHDLGSVLTLRARPLR